MAFIEKLREGTLADAIEKYVPVPTRPLSVLLQYTLLDMFLPHVQVCAAESAAEHDRGGGGLGPHGHGSWPHSEGLPS